MRKGALFESGGGKGASGCGADDKGFMSTPVKRRSGVGLAMQGSPSVVVQVLSPLGRRHSAACSPAVVSSGDGKVDNKQDFVSTPVKRRSGVGLAMQGSPSVAMQLLSPLRRRNSAPAIGNKKAASVTPVRRRSGVAMQGSPSVAMQLLGQSPSAFFNNSSSVQNKKDACVANLFPEKSSGDQDSKKFCIVVTGDDDFVKEIKPNNLG